MPNELFDINPTTMSLYTSNSLKTLAQELACQMIERPLNGIFKPEIIVVQTPGIKRWLSFELADILDVSANLQFITPNEVLTKVFSSLLDNCQNSIFDQQALVWAVMRILKSDFINRAEFSYLKKYIEDNDQKLYQLSQRIADLFDQYQMYRPELIYIWERGSLLYKTEAEIWQKLLWQQLLSIYGRTHRLAITEQLVTKLASLPPDSIKAMVERVWVFGVSTLSHYHLELLFEVGRKVAVKMFLLNPCKYYWGDINSKREQVWLRRRSKGKDTKTDLHLETGNRLLASLGKLGRSFISELFQFEMLEHFDIFSEKKPKTLLSNIQNDILNLTNPQKKYMAVEHASSITINSCHSPLREVEVLYDYLLSCFDNDRKLKPADITVMVTDIEAYAPYIDAVFKAGDHRISYSLADISYKKESTVADVFLAILSLEKTRYQAPDILALLSYAPIQKKFRIMDADLKILTDWVSKTNIAWGKDGESKEGYGLPPSQENTWQAGIKRMLLGYAMLDDGGSLYEGVLPFSEIEGSGSELLGKFIDFIEKLFEIVDSFDVKQDIASWIIVLKRIIEAFIVEDDDSARDVEYIYSAINSLLEHSQASGFDEGIGFKVIKKYFEEYLSFQSSGLGLIAGGVTFCSMVSMRGVPAKVIAVLGMSDSAFPRKSFATSFDLMQVAPKPLDRVLRDGDRYLFLEALISAQERFYVSYIGQDIQDNTVLQPSILVSELLDYIKQSYYNDGKDILETVFQKQPLQSFSKAYFQPNTNLFTYYQLSYKENKELLESVPNIKNIQKKQQELRALSSELDPRFYDISIDDLVHFFKNPAKYFLKNRLGVTFKDQKINIESKELFELEPLGSYKLRLEVLKYYQNKAKNNGINDLEKILRAKGVLPHGSVGSAILSSCYQEITLFVDRYELLVAAAPKIQTALNISLKLDGKEFRISGALDRVHKNIGQLFLKPTHKPSAKDKLELYIRHLATNLTSLSTSELDSQFMYINQKNDLKMEPISNPQKKMEDLVTIYNKGIQSLIKLSPTIIVKYNEFLKKGAPESEAATKAYEEFYKNTNFENVDPYFGCCFSMPGVEVDNSLLFCI